MSHLIMTIQVCHSCPHLAPCCYVLHCFWGIFAESATLVLSDVVGPGIHRSTVQYLFLCPCDQCSPATFMILATPFIYGISSCRDLSLHDGLTSCSFSSLGFCCLGHSLDKLSFGPIFLMYSWISFVSSWTGAH